IERMKGGADVALISDAGTPGISDPGYRLVRLAVANSIPVVPVPGPSALISVLSVSGLPAGEFTFKGFVPSADGKRKRFFLGLKGRSHTYIMYESARRLMETLDTVIDLLGDVDAVIGREVTKLHEEVMRGKVSALREGLKARDIKGEITLILRTEDEKRRPEDLPADIGRLLKSGMGIKEISKALAHEFDMPGAEVYREALKVREGLKS
ncbi:MAG: rRNA small subunit methyltransferase 1, partial [Deltaproteobacteria bacterium]|nr:rRNA small subunit methyltransferase 1 [Deltaproteobacteria bacterium]